METVQVTCPYCGESIELVIDSSLTFQKYIEDCEVCCQPISVVATVSENGEISVNVYQEDDT